MSGISLRRVKIGLLILPPLMLSLASTVFAATDDLVVKVKAGDTLSRIGWSATGIQARYIWQEIAWYNNIDPEEPLLIGSIIRIPANLFKTRELDASTGDTDPVSESIGSAGEFSSNARLNACEGSEICFEEQISEVAVQDEAEAGLLSTPETQEPLRDAGEQVRELVEDGAEDGIEDAAESVPDIEDVTQGRGTNDLNNTSMATVDSVDVTSGEQADESGDSLPELAADVEELTPVVTDTSTIESDQVESAVPAQGPQLRATDENNTGTDSAAAIAKAEAAANSKQQSSQTEAPEQRPPGLFDVDEDAAVRALERSLVQLNALLLNKGEIELGLDYTFASDTATEPVLITAADETDDAANAQAALALFEDTATQQFVTLDFKYGLPGDAQLNLALPYEILDSKTTARVGGDRVDSESLSISDPGDISIGFTKALFYEKGRRPDLLFSVNYDADTGNESGGLRTGSGADELTVGFNATKRQDPLVFTFGVSHTIAGKDNGFKAGSVSRLSFGTLLAASPYTSLLFEFDQSFIGNAEFDGNTLADTGTTSGSLLIGASSVVTRSVFVSAGLRMGLTENASDYQFTVGFSRRLGY